jgi:hypothetical protein
MSKEKMTKDAAARIQSAEAKKSGSVSKNTFAARAQSTADKNASKGNTTRKK